MIFMGVLHTINFQLIFNKNFFIKVSKEITKLLFHIDFLRLHEIKYTDIVA